MINIQSKTEHKEIKLSGYSIHYFVSGDSMKEAVIFLHPAFADHRCFDKQTDFFSKDFRMITIDMLGHGLSKADKAKDKIDMTVSHINTILSQEGYEKAHFVGVSMGSLVAQYYGLKHPEKVISMTILAGYDINADNSEISKAQRSEQFKWIFKALFSMDLFRKYVAKFSVENTEEKERFYEMSKGFTRKSFLVLESIIKLFPNPVSGIKLNYEIAIPVKSSNCIIKLVNMEGKQLDQFEITENQGELNLPSSVKNGMYSFLLYVNNRYSSTSRILILR